MLSKNIDNIIKSTKGVRLVAATKYSDSNEMREMYKLGIDNFGENRVLDFLNKYQELKDLNITWHFIGSLQTNKVEAMINKIDYLHSLDRIHLANYIERYRFKPLNCFVEVNMSRSSSKHGVLKEDVINFIESLKNYKKINVIGLMMMGDESLSKEENYKLFIDLRDLRNKLNELGYTNITELSMGMSNDYQEAIKASSTTVRLGRILLERGF